MPPTRLSAAATSWQQLKGPPGSGSCACAGAGATPEALRAIVGRRGAQCRLRPRLPAAASDSEATAGPGPSIRVVSEKASSRSVFNPHVAIFSADRGEGPVLRRQAAPGSRRRLGTGAQSPTGYLPGLGWPGPRVVCRCGPEHGRGAVCLESLPRSTASE